MCVCVCFVHAGFPRALNMNTSVYTSSVTELCKVHVSYRHVKSDVEGLGVEVKTPATLLQSHTSSDDLPLPLESNTYAT